MHTVQRRQSGTRAHELQCCSNSILPVDMPTLRPIECVPIGGTGGEAAGFDATCGEPARPPEPQDVGTPRVGDKYHCDHHAEVVAGAMPRPPEAPTMPHTHLWQGSTCLYFGEALDDSNTVTLRKMVLLVRVPHTSRKTACKTKAVKRRGRRGGWALWVLQPFGHTASRWLAG